MNELTSCVARALMQDSTSDRSIPVSFHFVVPGSRLDLYHDLSVPSRIAMHTSEMLSLPQGIPDPPSINDEEILITDFSRIDRSVVTPRSIRYLLGRFDRCIKPRYDLLGSDILAYEGVGLRKLPDLQRFQVLMACAIAAVQESYRNPSWKLVAQICRTWANELITPILATGDGDCLASLLILLVYEMADPSRGLTWELIDLAMRTCLQLGWHRTTHVTSYPIGVSDYDNALETSTCGPNELRLIKMLRDIER